MVLESLSRATGTKATHVPYRASNQIIQDLIGGQIQMTCDQFSTAYPQVKAYWGRLAERPSFKKVLAHAEPYLSKFMASARK